MRYDYAVGIEHEDRNFEGNEDRVKRGFYISRAVLRPFIHYSKIFSLSITPLRCNRKGWIYQGVKHEEIYRL